METGHWWADADHPLLKRHFKMAPTPPHTFYDYHRLQFLFWHATFHRDQWFWKVGGPPPSPGNSSIPFASIVNACWEGGVLEGAGRLSRSLRRWAPSKAANPPRSGDEKHFNTRHFSFSSFIFLMYSASEDESQNTTPLLSWGFKFVFLQISVLGC